MKKTAWFLIVAMTLPFIAATCLQSRDGQPNQVQQTGAGISAISSALPPPFNAIALAIGGVASLAGTVLAQKASSSTPTTSPAVKLFTTHNWIMPVVGVGLSLLNATGKFQVTPGELSAIWGILGTPEVGEQVAKWMGIGKTAAPQK